MSFPYSPEYLELDFSHWAAWQTASVKGPIDARETLFRVGAHEQPEISLPSSQGMPPAYD